MGCNIFSESYDQKLSNFWVYWAQTISIRSLPGLRIFWALRVYSLWNSTKENLFEENGKSWKSLLKSFPNNLGKQIQQQIWNTWEFQFNQNTTSGLFHSLISGGQRDPLGVIIYFPEDAKSLNMPALLVEGLVICPVVDCRASTAPLNHGHPGILWDLLLRQFPVLY